MRRALANQPKVIRIPPQTVWKMAKIQAAWTKLLEELGRDPTDKELAKETGFTERTIGGLRMGKSSTVSLQDPIQNGEEGEFHEIIPDEKTKAPDHIIQDEETLTLIMELLKKLDEREYTILTLRFGLDGSKPKTLEEVSVAIGRTRERVRQIQNQALEKLKKSLEDNGYTEFDKNDVFGKRFMARRNR